MDYQEIKQKIYNIVSKNLSINIDSITPQMSLNGNIGELSLNVDSFEYVKIIIDIESTFHITVDFEVTFNTINDIVNYINDSLKVVNR